MAVPASLPARLVLSALAGVVLSLLKLLLHCRLPTSEACVWGKAYLPLSLPIEAAIFGGGVFLVLTMMRAPRRP